MLGALASLFAVACGSGGEECLPCRGVRTVDVRLAGSASQSGLAVPLYLFRRDAGSSDEYRYVHLYPSVADGQRLKLPLDELKAYDYRFLAVAQPEGAAWLTLRAPDGTAYAQGAAWSDLRLSSANGAAESDGYCGYTDRSGEALLNEGNVHLTLTRVAGQAVFACYRMGDSLSQPVGVVSEAVASVLDRISRIDIAYANLTTMLRFDESGMLVPAAYAAEPLTQTILPVMTDLKVALPQTDRGLGVYDTSSRGSARIAGAFLLPSDSKLRIRMTFVYYDTTPACGNSHTGSHIEACYTQRQLTLDLPAANAASGLPVAADCFTINRAGLRCDRIIDVAAGGGVDADFDWL